MDREQIIQWAREAGFSQKDAMFRQVFIGNVLDIERFASLVRADEREAIFDEWHSCLMSDLEHGVKSLNEKAAEEWHKNYPAQSKMFPEWLKARGNT
jgi:hypothetical protein